MKATPNRLLTVHLPIDATLLAHLGAAVDGVCQRHNLRALVGDGAGDLVVTTEPLLGEAGEG